jgi:TolB-like protein/DNA-binding winged helix-turn-helix (wHTH) protein/Flp pilus assembly protein TadD
MVRFGQFEFEKGELRRNGEPLRLPAQPARLLALLLAHSGQLVTREEIRQEIWGSETYVDFEQGINFCIRQIRGALEDDADSPRFLQTIPKRGYRFLVPPEPAEQTAPAKAPPRRFRWTLVAGAAALTLGVLTLGLGQRRATDAGPAEPRPMLAVLPFQVLEGGTDQDYLGLSLTEELITLLGQRYSGRLGVIARTSAMRFADPAHDVRRIRQELGVDYLLEGAIRPAGDRLRVTARLIRAEDAVQLWTGEYTRHAGDLLEVQRDIGEQITRALALNILPQEDRPAPAAATSPEAYDLYLQGRHHLGSMEPDAFKASVEAFRGAIGRDPKFAPAYAGLATALMRATRGAGRFESREAALQAVALDESLSEAHLLLANQLFYFDLDPEGARHEFELALAGNPVSAEAHHAFAAYFSARGRHDEALAEVRKALALDPLSAMVNSDIGWYFYFARRYDEAIAHSRRTLELSPGFYWAEACILHASIRKGDFPAALDVATAEMKKWGADEKDVARLSRLPASAALEEFWRWELAADRGPWYVGRTPADIAVLHVSLGENEQAMDSLEEAFDQRSGWLLPFLGVAPMFDPLRDSPRFMNLLARVDQRARLAAARP